MAWNSNDICWTVGPAWVRKQWLSLPIYVSNTQILLITESVPHYTMSMVRGYESHRAAYRGCAYERVTVSLECWGAARHGGVATDATQCNAYLTGLITLGLFYSSFDSQWIFISWWLARGWTCQDWIFSVAQISNMKENIANSIL